MTTTADLRAIFDEARPLVEQALDLQRSLNALFMRAWACGGLDDIWAEFRGAYGKDRLPYLQYFIRSRGTGDIKIGKTNFVRQRFKTLLVGASRGLDLVACYPAERDHETELKGEFSHCRLRGEWFFAHSDLLAYLRLLGVDVSKFTNEPAAAFLDRNIHRSAGGGA